MTTFRVFKNEDYSIISNDLFNDERLSWKAKGLMGWLLSRPAGWKIFLKDLQTRSKDGRDATAAAIKELIENGYIERTQVREKGIFKGYHYNVYESPRQENRTGKTAADNPNTENPTLVITELNKELSKEIYDKTKNESSKQTKQKPVFDFTDFSQSDQDSINEWLQYKTERKEPYKSQTGLNKFRKQLLEFKRSGQNIRILIDKSIARNWVGVWGNENKSATSGYHAMGDFTGEESGDVAF